MSGQPDWHEDDELDTRKPLFLRVVAGIVIVGLVLFIADLFFTFVVKVL